MYCLQQTAISTVPIRNRLILRFDIAQYSIQHVKCDNGGQNLHTRNESFYHFHFKAKASKVCTDTVSHLDNIQQYCGI